MSIAINKPTIMGDSFKPVSPHFRNVLLPPIFIIILATLGNYFYQKYIYFFVDKTDLPALNIVEQFSFYFSLALSFYWLFTRIINNFTKYLLSTSFLTAHQTTSILLPFFSSVLKTIVFLILFNALIPYLGLPSQFSYFLDKLSSCLIICAISWILFKLVHIAEQLLLHRYNSTTDNALARKIYTQTLILKRIAMAIIAILTVGAILMLFDNVRALGASVLTTAGVIGLVLTFTAQRSLASLFSGLEIALTQPIKIGDSVVIEDEFGVVEEINFRNVIIKLWDWRRLVVPTNYFLEHSFQNWSREESNNLIGTVYLYVDFTLPVDEMRDELKRVLSNSALWDGKVCSIQVSDVQDRVMELRILASARTPGDAWDLRCEVREKLIDFVVRTHPTSLPVTRTRQIQLSEKKITA
ncbi:small-conductance mechanosensitive channel [Legionella busanensis]|uniref:Small-conductance mechanosensitive channel n=1 Tax=Legionella busanensis TaxID=190655 RepID=A0A378JNA2_9GAMM|nr:mechanosensitive ion channel domain-containing protein [Legionella busanensis]STX52734.1 small-conductance mechanosensitive channel [Legionella busanensis]